MSINFRGYAQKSTVQSNLIKAPDKSSQILEEGRRYLQQWRSNSTDERASREAYISKLEQNFKIQEGESLTNKKLIQGYADNFKQNLQQHHDVRQKAATVDADQYQQNQKRVAHLSQTLAQGIGKIAEGYTKDREAYGKHLALRYGLGTQDIKDLKNLDGNIRDYEGKNIEIVNELRSQNASWERINQIRSLSGFSMRGVRIGEAIRVGENYKGYLLTNYDKEYTLPNGLPTTSLAAAERQGNKALIDQLLLKIENEYLASPGVEHLHHTLIAEHVSEPVARANGRIKTYVAQNELKQIRAKSEAEATQVVVASIKKGGPQGFWDYVELEGGTTNYSGSRAAGMRSLTEAFSTGQLGWEDLNRFGEYKITPRDGGEPVEFQDRFSREYKDLKKSLATYQREQAQINDSDRVLRDSEDKAEAEQMRSTLVANWHTYDNPTAIIRNMLGKMQHNTHAQNALIALLPSTNQTNINDKIGEPFLYTLLNENKLTRNAVLNQKLSPKATNKWLNLANENDQFKPDKEEEKRFNATAKRTIEEILAAHGTEAKKVGSSASAEYDARLKLRQYFRQAMAGEANGNRALATSMAESQLKADVEKGEFDIVSQKMVRKDGREILLQSPHFKKFEREATRYPHAYSKFTTEDFRQNPNLLDDEPIIDRPILERFVKDLQNNRFTKWPTGVEYVATKFLRKPDGTMTTPAEIVFRQCEYWGLEVPEALLDIYNQASTGGGAIPPELMRFTTGTHTTKNSVNAVLIRSGLQPQGHYRTEYENQLVNNYTGKLNPLGLSKSALELYTDLEGFTTLGGAQ